MNKELEIENKTELTTSQKIRALMGYVENGSDIVISLFQDDATKDYFIKATSLGEEIWCEWDRNFETLIDRAYEEHAEKFD